MQIFFVITATLAALASADVSHLGSSNYHVPISTGNSVPQNVQPQSLAHIESIKASVPIASFTIQQNVGHGQTFDSNSYSSAQSTGSYNYNAPVQQPQSLHVQQQSFSTPASIPIQQSCTSSEPAALQNAYLAPTPQQQYSGIGPIQQTTHSAADPLSVQSYPALGQNSYLPPASVHQQLHSNFAHAQDIQQSYSGPVSAPIQQSFSTPTAVQQQSYNSAGQIQQQFGHQQQSHEGVKTTSAVDNDAYSYQAAISAAAPDQPSLSAPIQQTNSVISTGHQQTQSLSGAKESLSLNYQGPAPVQQSYTGPNIALSQQSHGGIDTNNVVDSGAYNYQAPGSTISSVQQNIPVPGSTPGQQSYSVSSNDHQQSHLSSVTKSGSFNYQPSIQSYPNPVSTLGQQSNSGATTSAIHQPVTAAVSGESGSFNYHPATPVQQHYSTPVQQSYSAPNLAQLHQAVTTSVGASVHQSETNPITSPQSVEYPVPAPQKVTFPTPAVELSAPTATPEVGTVYGQNGGYVYQKF